MIWGSGWRAQKLQRAREPGRRGVTGLKGMPRLDIPSSEVVQDQPFWRLGIVAGVL